VKKSRWQKLTVEAFDHDRFKTFQTQLALIFFFFPTHYKRKRCQGSKKHGQTFISARALFGMDGKGGSKSSGISIRQIFSTAKSNYVRFKEIILSLI